LDLPLAQITLADVAERAGVTVQTVIRRFGDKEALFAGLGPARLRAGLNRP
jgi:AcrR family transcriptional regulator